MKLEHKTLAFEIKELNDETGTFEGYASTWGVDLGNDQIIKGAFANTINNRRSRNQIKLLPLHQWTFPIGKIEELREDEKGLYVKAKLLPTEGELGGKNALMLIKAGVLNEMSIGYNSEEEEYNDAGVRILKKLDLMEISLVLFGMNQNTEITSMKSVLENQALKDMQNDMFFNTYKKEFKRQEEKTEKEKLIELFRKELNEKDSLNTMLENKIKEKLNIEKGLCIMEIFLDEVIFNYYSYGDSMLIFDKYMRQGYTVRGNEIELVGEMVEVEIGRVFSDKKQQAIMHDIKNIIKSTIGG